MRASQGAHGAIFRFARRHRLMLAWLGILAVTTVVLSGAGLWTAPTGEWLFYIVVALPLGGGALAVGAELTGHVRAYISDGQRLGPRVFVTMALGTLSLVMTAGLVFLTVELFDMISPYRDLASYRRIVAEAEQGALPAGDVFQQRYGVSYYRENGPGLRIIFSVRGIDAYEEAVIYDSTGRVATPPRQQRLDRVRSRP
jgi:hypothetical protein